MKLPIEDYPDLLQEYGRAFAWINVVEFTLDNFLLWKIRPKETDSKITRRMLDKMTLGKKISFVSEKGYLKEEIIKDLWELNRFRISLAHGISSASTISLFHENNKGEKYIEEYKFSKLLPETIKLAKNLEITIEYG